MLGNNKLYIYEDSLVSVNVNKRSFTHQTLFFYDLTKQAKLIIHSLIQLSLVFRISLSHSSTIFFFFSFNFGTQKQPIITEKTFFAHYKFEVLSEMLAEMWRCKHFDV